MGCRPPPAGAGTNPLFTDTFTADPAAMVDGCTFYVTAGHDEAAPGQNQFVMREWYLLSSTDMVHWTRTVGMSLRTFSWANANAWAGQMIKGRNGKYYWYVPIQEAATGAMAIGVAVADAPAGPWRDAIGKPLVSDAIEMSNMGFAAPGDTPFTIDPTVFIDDDGQAYLQYGGFWRMVTAKLNADMTSISGRMVETTPPDYWESPYLIKRNGLYYQIYASGSNPAPISYATATSPMGPWTRRGVVLDPLPKAPGQSDAPTNHAGVAELAGQWYVVYHVSDGPNGGGTYRRQVAIDKLTFNADGTIKRVIPSRGVVFDGSSGSGSSSGGSGSSGGSSSSGGPGSSSSGGSSSSSGGASSSGGGACVQGTSTTSWATSCPTSAPACTAGTWVPGGTDPEHTHFRLIAESPHFAVYSDENPSGAQAALDYLETVWAAYFGAPFYMREPLCNATTKYKASVHVHGDWGLTAGSWAPGHMGMWIGTGGLSDHWGLAHEFTHGVQMVQGGMSCGGPSDTCGWVYESHANWHPQQLPEFHTKELHCSEMLANAPHLYLGSTRDRYCNWQFMEFLKDKHCFSAVNAIWTGAPQADPFSAIMSAMGWNVGQLNDFFGEWAMHNVTWDYQDPPPQKTAGQNQGALYRSVYGSITDTSQAQRRLRLTRLEPLDGSYATHRRFVSPWHWAPQRWGYNVIRLYPEAGATSVTVTFRGVIQAAARSDFRWGLVATDAAITKPRYSPLQRGTDGQLTFCVNAGEPLFLVVMGTPTELQKIVWDQPYGSIFRYPYMVQLAGAWPEGFQGGKPDACPQGTSRHANGGGCATSSTPASVYVGPFARVLGGTVSGNARIEDQATVLNGSVTNGTVGALSIVGSAGGFYNTNAFSVNTSGEVMTTFYPLGFFEGGQGVSGSASLVGDVEYRGQGLNRSSGVCSGFVDGSTCVNAAEVTVPPPYAWRP